MKKVSIIASDTVPIPLLEGTPTSILIDSKQINTKDKFTNHLTLGKRAWKFAEEICKIDNFEVTLLIPDINFPPKEYIDFSKFKFKIVSYNLKSATWDWSEELDRKLKNENFVIVQSTAGIGFLNCSVLPSEVNVIIDGYAPIFTELPCQLIGYSNIYKKITWDKFHTQYTDLLKRANCILYATDRQLHYYEGQLFSMGKLNWAAFQFSPLLKVPHGMDVVLENKIPTSTNRLKLLWYGPFQSWHNPEILLESISELKNIDIDFIFIKHPRQDRSYNQYFKKIIDSVDNSNISIIEDYKENIKDIYKEYDAGILLSKNWLEERYSTREIALDML